MKNELKKLAAAMRDMSDMVGDHHWYADKAVEELGTLRAELDRMNRVADANNVELCRVMEELRALKSEKAEPIQYGQLDPQQRLDVARGVPAAADGLEVVAWLCEWIADKRGGVHSGLSKTSLEGLRRSHGDDVLIVSDEPLCRLTDAQRLLSQLREELAQRDAEIERLRMQLAACGVVALANTPESATKARDMHPDYRSASCDDVAGAVDREMAYRAALESQQAASVGGDLEAPKVVGYLLEKGNGLLSRMNAGDNDFPLMTVAQHERIVAALSPAGGWAPFNLGQFAKAALKGGQEAVAEVSAETFSSDGTSDIITRNLPIGTKLYTAPPEQASAWVAVSERLPADKRDVMLYCGDTKEHFVGFSKGGCLFQFAQDGNGISIVCRPSHWRYIEDSYAPTPGNGG
ncbi:MAG: DUF551 domain-containing protein [Pseudomonas sp.]